MRKGPIVLTPHPGEMSRLLGIDTKEVNADRISAAKKLAEMTGAVALLKGSRSVIATPTGEVYINSTRESGHGHARHGRCVFRVLPERSSLNAWTR